MVQLRTNIHSTSGPAAQPMFVLPEDVAEEHGNAQSSHFDEIVQNVIDTFEARGARISLLQSTSLGIVNMIRHGSGRAAFFSDRCGFPGRGRTS